MHWITTAVALAAVVAGAAVLQPADAKATTGESRANSAPHPGGVVRAPTPARPTTRWTAARRSRKSSTTPRETWTATAAPRRSRWCAARPVPAPRRAASTCSPEPTARGPTRVVATFLDPKERMSATDFALRSGTVFATLLGYSSDQVPRCCPDLQRKVNWKWRDGKFVLTALPVPGSV
ncbi:hypothetical protein NKH77_10655 [Streptomyces sp. M19]